MPEPSKTIRRTSQFKRDAKRAQRQGKDLGKLRGVVEALVAGDMLDERFRDHALVGGYKGSRECHLEPDWLLIYEATDEEVVLVRTGTHADLFKTQGLHQERPSPPVQAGILREAIEAQTPFRLVRPPQTNIVLFDTPGRPAADVVARLAEQGVLASAFGPETVRLITHRDVDDAGVARAAEALVRVGAAE